MRVLFILGVFCVSTLVASCAPFIQRDPTAPNFAETQFVLEDYTHFNDFRDIMKTLFPVGTPKEKIDYVLVERNKASLWDASNYKEPTKLMPGEKVIRYIKPHNRLLIKCTFRVKAVYDSSNLLSREINGYYGCTGP